MGQSKLHIGREQKEETENTRLYRDTALERTLDLTTINVTITLNVTRET